MTPRLLFENTFIANAEQLRQIRGHIRTSLETLPYSPEVIEKIIIAVNEACMNIVQHAYKSTPNGEILIKIYNNDSELTISLVDHADSIDFSKIKPRQLHDVRPGGLGTHFISEIMDEVEYSRLPDNSGNQLIMKIRQ